MDYRRLGDSGLMVSAVGLGCNRLGTATDYGRSEAIVGTAIDNGVTLFDTADTYGASEEHLGKALRNDRDRIVLATKFSSDMHGANGPDWGARGSRRYIVTAVEASLRRLRTDRIDLLQMHKPDPGTPIAETLAALDLLVSSGKVLYIGSSNFAAWQIVDAAWTSRTSGGASFVCAQNEFNLLTAHRGDELLDALRAAKVGLLPYLPLGAGLLTDARPDLAAPESGSRLSIVGADRERWRRPTSLSDALAGLRRIADQGGISLLELAIGWLLGNPLVGSVIAGARSPNQVAANVKAADAGLDQATAAAVVRWIDEQRA